MILEVTTQAEITRLIGQARAGDWIPFSILGGVFSVIIFLLLYIWNQFVKNNKERHCKNEERQDRQDDTISKIEDNQTALRILSQKYDTKLESHQGQISQNRRDISKAG